jgi:hypothetical protein
MGPVRQAQQAEIRRILCSTGAQAKFTIGQPNDKYEKEADRVAEQVMRMSDTDVVQRQPENEDEEETVQTKPLADQIIPLVQRREEPVEARFKDGEMVQHMCPECEEEIAQRQPMEEEEEDVLQTKEVPGQSPQMSNELEGTINSLRGVGKPLSNSVRDYMEPRFGHDFNQVRVHTYTQAATVARSINARAFTLGQDVAFDSGQYSPQTRDGQSLLAHELTHVLQQDKRHSKYSIQRSPTESGINDRRYSYSTHCGWIDWGHTNPGLARTLIAQVREASQRIGRRETQLSTTVRAGLPAFIREPVCNSRYESNEVHDSESDEPVHTINEMGSGAIEVRVGGFGVGSSDAAKFIALISTMGTAIPVLMSSRGRKFIIESYGFTDCLGSERRNSRLRNERNLSLLALILVGLTRVTNAPSVQAESKTTAIDNYLESNYTRRGRKVNRGAMFRLIPQVTPEQFETMRMESSALGITVTGVTPTIALNRSLTESEILSVALGIFMAQSFSFETLQGWTDAIAGSSFSEEDLTSNLISFYRAARGYSSREIRTLCDVWDNADSIERLENVSLTRNRAFRPPSLPSGGQWPAELNTIRRIAPGSELYRITEALLETAVLSRRIRIR